MKYLVIKARPILVALSGLVLCICVVMFASVNNRAPVVSGEGDYSYPIYSVETDEPRVALGINCAWDNADVEALINLLEEAEVRASFFVSGSWCDKYPHSVRALYDAGHEIGSHSNTHTDMTTLGEEEILQEIRRSSEKIRSITGEAPRLFRTPSGSYNETVIHLIRQEGLVPIQWDCDSVDYQEQSAAEMEARIRKNLKNGSIFLFHCGGKNTVQALPGIITSLQEDGYEFVMVSELVYPEPYRVDFEGRQYPA